MGAAMKPHRSPLERMLDLAVYAPLGAALALRDHLPSLADEGRQRFASQARLARVVGEMALNEGRRQVASVVGRRAEGSSRAGPGPMGGAGEEQAGGAPTVQAAAAARAAATAAATAAPRASDSGLPIPGYDTLSASQVVQRLEGLGPAELAAVRSHEEGGRNRKTVLLRISQLGA